MDLLKKTQTPFQEIVLALSLAVSLWSSVAVLLYFFSSNPSTYLFFGYWGFSAIQNTALYLGYAFFLVPFILFKLGFLIISKCESFSDLRSLISKIAIHLAANVSSLMLAASFLDVFVAYFGIGFSNQKFLFGPGGVLGHLIGSWLYSNFGFGGALVVLDLIGILGAQLAGEFSIADFLTRAESSSIAIYNGLKKITLKLFHKISHKIQVRLGWKSDSALDKLEFQIQQACERQRLHHAVDMENTATAIAVAESYALDNQIQPLDIAVNQNHMTTEIEVSNRETKNTKKSASKPKIKVVVDNTQTKNEKTDLDLENQEADTTDNSSDESKNVDVIEDISIEVWKKSYSYPSKSLLKQSKKFPGLSATAKKQQADLVQKCLAGFGLEGKVVAVHAGIRLNMFEFEPSVGVKVSKIQALTNDLALSLGASSIRILAPIPGKNTVGIEIPSKSPGSLCLGDMIDAALKNKSATLPFALGKDVYGEVLVEDLAKMPHLLVAGTTGSGKSVFTNTLISSLIYNMSPRDLRFIMVDPKMIELTPYNGIPHLLKPVISDVEESKNALVWAEHEMDRRYKVFAELGARNIESFNQKIKGLDTKALARKLGREPMQNLEHMPYIVIVIDELADLMITQGKEVEKPITRIAQKARACGIHLVLATQRPSAEIVTGLIKTNFPSRIAFKVSSSVDSRTILDNSGAEKLLGQGDMLYLPNGKHIVRVQGAFLSEEEVQKLVKFVKD